MQTDDPAKNYLVLQITETGSAIFSPIYHGIRFCNAVVGYVSDPPPTPPTPNPPKPKLQIANRCATVIDFDEQTHKKRFKIVARKDTS